MKQIFSLLCTLALCAMVAVGCSDDNDDAVKKTYTVTFDSQGGSAVSAQTVKEGEKVAEPAAPTKAGVVFGGWYTSTDYAKAWDFDKSVVTEDITLYARWASKTFTVSFDTNGGTPIESQEVAEGGLIANLPIPVKDGSAFAGWYTDKGLTTKFNENTPITGNTTLYAKWTEVTLTALQELVEQSYSLKSDNYTDDSYDKMIQKRDAARNIISKENPTAKEIATAYQDLSKAISELIELPKRITVALSISPQPIDGIIYINPTLYQEGYDFSINAYGVDSDNEESTNSKVIFEYNGLEDWAIERSGEESGTDKIYKSDNYLSFIPKIDLDANAQIDITIKSADNTALAQKITLKVINSNDAKSKFLSIINGLPAISEVNWDNFEEIDNLLDGAYDLYNSLSESDRAIEEVRNAYNKINKYWDAIDMYWKVNYTFEGNTCIIEDERYSYVADGSFPAGTYTLQWESNGIDENGNPEYYQSRLTLKADKTYETHERISNSADGKNPTDWSKDSDGEYKYTGNQTNGGVLYMHQIHYYDDDYYEPVITKAIFKLHKKVKVRK